MILPTPIHQHFIDNRLTELSDELNKAYRTRQIFRTETEARISVLDDVHFPNNAAKYWQCIREQTVQLDQLAQMSFEFRRNELNIKRQESVIQNSKNTFEVEAAQIELDECLYKKTNLETVANDRIREILMWSKIKAELDDGSFDTENVDTHQLISYTQRFIKRAINAENANLNSGEIDNLAGQLQSSLKRCQELGVMDVIKQSVSENVFKQITEVL